MTSVAPSSPAGSPTRHSRCRLRAPLRVHVTATCSSSVLSSFVPLATTSFNTHPFRVLLTLRRRGLFISLCHACPAISFLHELLMQYACFDASVCPSCGSVAVEGDGDCLLVRCHRRSNCPCAVRLVAGLKRGGGDSASCTRSRWPAQRPKPRHCHWTAPSIQSSSKVVASGLDGEVQVWTLSGARQRL